ncbi:FMN-binding protein [Flagellimonas pelagia]|uniref:FMN-binding protein n=2 Tax=Flagellimonas pelagia TaxID=2306998 RepID=A0A3A1NFC8_9FLAO|nr:FMN-binding protein [Allomuricauda maritima]TXJ93207.1 FMN-binding protein [Allomuricauda maritima]
MANPFLCIFISWRNKEPIRLRFWKPSTSLSRIKNKLKMLRENRFKALGGAVLCMAFFLVAFQMPKISPKLQEKVDNAVQTTFELEDFSLEPVVVDAALNQKTPSELGGENLFRIKTGESAVGYVYLGEAPSLKNVFDYVVLFTPELAVKKSKILIYREDHGRQVGSQRWLKQFIGKKSGETLVYGEDIDGISGATISAKSMTLAVSNILESMKVLNDQHIL